MRERRKRGMDRGGDTRKRRQTGGGPKRGRGTVRRERRERRDREVETKGEIIEGEAGKKREKKMCETQEK